jgi:broad specificity phosphatase PhoE
MADTIFLVRHGESESNAEKYFAGHFDSPLTALGKRQALLLKKRLEKEDFGRAFCSDLGRCRDTIRALSLRCPIEYTMELRENRFGELEGVRWGEEEEKYARFHSDAFARAPGGGESAADLQSRVMAYFRKEIFPSQGEKALVVTHHGPIVVFACAMLGMPLANWRHLRLGNCGLSIFTREGKLWRMKLWNSLSHFGLESFTPLLKSDS